MIQVYSENNKNFSSNGDMTLLPEDASVSVELNGSWNLTMQHPIDKKGRWKYLEEGAVIKAPSFNGEQLFRIYKKEKSEGGTSVEAYPIFFDSKNDCFLTDIRPTGKNGQEALNIMLAPNKKYSAQSDIAKSTTAYYEYMNLMEAINGDNANSFLNRWGGEILYDNFKIIVNERVGGDYGVELRYGKNIPANGITETVDMSEVVTRIYPKSYNGYKLSGNGYADSPILSNYPTVKAATMKFDNIKMREDAQEDDEEKGIIICDTQADLDKALTEACRKQFESGLDKPKVTIEADMVLLKNTDQYKDYEILETVSLGDTIHCRHDKLGIISDARVVGLEYDCILNRVTSVVLGQFQSNYIDNIASSVDKIDSVINSEGDIMAERVKGILDGITTQLRLQSTVAKKVKGRAFIAEDLDPNSPLYGCIAWGTQGIEIANRRTADGRDWDWSTAVTANGIVANAIVTGLLSDKTGTNFWNLDTGDFRLSSSDFRVDDQLIKDLIKVESSKAQNFNVYTYPSELHIERSANGQIIDEFPDTKIEIDVMMGDKTVDKECEIELEVSGNVAAVLRKNSTGKYYIDVLNINRYEGYVIVKAMYKNRLYAEKKIPIYRIERNANESTKAYYATAWPTTVKILKTGELHEYSKKLEIMTFRTAIINGKKRNVLNHSKVEYQLRGFDDSKKTYTTLETKTVNGECYFDLTFDVVKKYNSLEATAKYFYDNNEIEATVKVVIPIIYEAINLTHEDIFNLLTNNGEIKGIYRENGQLYISFTYAKGGTMTLGGTGNASGLMSLQDTNGREFGKMDNKGFTIRDTATGNKTRLIPTGIVREEGGKSMPYHYLTFFGEKTISKEEFSGGGNTECFYEGTIDLLINQLPVGFRLKKENVQLQVTSLESGMDLNSIIMASLTNMSLNVLSVRYLNMDSCWSIRFRCDCSYLTQVNNNMKPRYIAPKSMTIGYTIIG